MKMTKKQSVLNLWDTSFRRQSYTKIIPTILQILSNYCESKDYWKKDYFKIYKQIIDNPNNGFERKTPTKVTAYRRAGTLVNGLVKLGFLKKDTKELTPIAYMLLAIKNHSKGIQRDLLEKLLPISDTNILYLRQLLKLRVFNTKHSFSISPIKIGIYLLKKYKYIDTDNFFKLIFSLNPNYITPSALANIINDYKLVAGDKESFKKFYQLHFLRHNTKITSKVLNDTHQFARYFTGNGSFNSIKDNSQKKYWRFVHTLLSWKNDKVRKAMNERKLIQMSKYPTIKKSFGFGTEPFTTSKDVTFSKEYIKNPLLSGNINQIHQIFLLSKRHDLLREYSNMDKRILELSNIFSIGLHGISLKEKSLWNLIPIQLNDCYTKDTNTSNFIHNISCLFILNISQKAFIKQVNKILERKGKNLRQLKEVFQQENNKETFQQLKETYSVKKVVKALKLLRDRKNDKKLQKLIGRHVDVPTIAEFVVDLALLYLHRHPELQDMHDVFHVELDSHLVPINPAPGGIGDAEYKNANTILLGETTLQSQSSQKKGEIEPVERHATDLKRKNMNKKVITLFVAQHLDYHETVPDFLEAWYKPFVMNNKRKEYIHGLVILPTTFTSLIQAFKDHDTINVLINKLYKRWFNEASILAKKSIANIQLRFA